MKTPDEAERSAVGTTADVQTSSVWFAGVVGTLLVTIVVLAVSVLAFRKLNTEAAANTAEPVLDLQRLLAAQHAKLEGQAGGPVGKPRLSIERAMQLVVEDSSAPLKQEPPHAK